MKLSEKMWNNTSSIRQSIIEHPFNQELMHGTLADERFAFYIKQDSLFLKGFAKSLASIASRSENSTHIEIFLTFAKNTIVGEHTIIANYLGSEISPSTQMSPACLSFTNFLSRTCSLEPIEVAIAAVLPCFWIYQQVGQHIHRSSIPLNPFGKWINTYANEKFADDVATVITIFDEAAENSTPYIRDKMEEAFYESAMLEWHFWNDAYAMELTTVL